MGGIGGRMTANGGGDSGDDCPALRLTGPLATNRWPMFLIRLDPAIPGLIRHATRAWGNLYSASNRFWVRGASLWNEI